MSIPDWLPNWRDESAYPDPKITSMAQWAWEFLRRNPRYQNDCKSHPAVVFEQYGISWPVQPAVQLSDAFADALFSDGVPWNEVVIGPTDPSLSFDPLRLTPSQALLKVDLEYPVDAQLQALGGWLKEIQREMETNGELTVKKSRTKKKQNSLYRNYLRVLDADAAGVANSDVARTLLPCMDNTYPDYLATQTIKGWRIAAKELRDGGYRKLCVIRKAKRSA